MCAAPSARITIRNSCVSLLKHTRAIYATPAFRIYVAVLTVALAGAASEASLGAEAAPRPSATAAPRPSATAAPRPWRAHVREAREYAESRAGQVSFGVRTRRRLRGVDVERSVPS